VDKGGRNHRSSGHVQRKYLLDGNQFVKVWKAGMLYAMGNRIAKIVSTPTKNDTTAYVRDASGNVMTIYNNRTAAEAPIYGSGRIGEYTGKEKEGYQTFNLRKYELANHLGNVLAVISDKVNLYGHGNRLDSARATVAGASDYYPFGLEMKGRSFNGTGYRFGYSGKEKLDEVMGEGNFVDLGERGLDTRIGRLNWKPDPLAKNFPWNSPYAYAENDVIRCIDLDGLEKVVIFGGADLMNTGMLTMEEITVNLLVPVDVAFGPMGRPLQVSDNVETVFNFYQTNPSLIRSRGYEAKPQEGNNKTIILNGNVTGEKTTHKTMDEDTQKDATNIIKAEMMGKLDGIIKNATTRTPATAPSTQKK